MEEGDKVWSPHVVKSSFQKDREAAEKDGMTREMKQAIKAAADSRKKNE